MNILAISGSLRDQSYNHQLATAARTLLERTRPEVSFTILEWDDVPLFNQDHEFPAPEPVARAREEVKRSDGIWIFTPEYNHSYPGVLKNLIDWLSRPVGPDEGQVLAGKPVAFSGTSIGTSGSSHAQEHLIPLLSFVNMQIMNSPRLVIPNIGEQTDEDGRLALTTSARHLEKQANAFIDFIEEHSSAKK